MKEDATTAVIAANAATAAKIVADAAAAAAQAVLTAATKVNEGVNTDISYIKRDISEIKQSLKELSGLYATKTEVLEEAKVTEDHEARLRSIEHNMWKWIGIASAGSILLGISGSVLLNLFGLLKK